MKTPRPEIGKSDSERRKIQAHRVAEIISVHGEIQGRNVDMALVNAIARKLKRCERTVWRHIKTLKHTYDIIESESFDGKTGSSPRFIIRIDGDGDSPEFVANFDASSRTANQRSAFVFDDFPAAKKKADAIPCGFIQAID